MTGRKLINEAELDSRFDTQMKKIEDATSRLMDIVTDMKKPGSMTQPVDSQRMRVKHAVQDLVDLQKRL